MAASAEPVDGLSLRHVTRRFGACVAVDDVTLDVERGRVLCLVGPSGCGKTTALRIAAGLERPDAGLVFVGGDLVEGEGRHVPPEDRGVGLMFQDYALFPHLTVAANVGFGVSRLPRRERQRRCEEELGRVGLGHLAGGYPHTLSGGEQQRVALARMLAPRPRVVLMDEPFSGLDPSLRDSIRAGTLRRLREADAAVVIVTHDPEEATRIGDRVALMREGRIVQEGTPLDIYRNPCDPQAVRLFGGANLFHAQVIGGRAASPFGTAAAASVPEGQWAEVLFRSVELWVAEEGVPARVTAVRPLAGQVEVEAALEPGALPAGVEGPTLVRASAPAGAVLAPGAVIRIHADPGDALVFPCLDKGCRG